MITLLSRHGNVEMLVSGLLRRVILFYFFVFFSEYAMKITFRTSLS